MELKILGTSDEILEERSVGRLSHAERYALLYALYKEWQGREVTIELGSIPERDIRMALFDLDGTLVKGEYMHELAPFTTSPDKMRRFTQEALDGEEEWEQSFRKRVALLKGIPVEQALEIAQQMKVSDKMKSWIEKLQKRGCEVGILTGAYHRLALLIADELGVELVCSSHLEEQDGLLTGRVEGTPLTPYRKALTLIRFAEERELSLDQVLAVGDSVADFPMLSLAGHSLLCCTHTPLPMR